MLVPGHDGWRLLGVLDSSSIRHNSYEFYRIFQKLFQSNLVGEKEEGLSAFIKEKDMKEFLNGIALESSFYRMRFPKLWSFLWYGVRSMYICRKAKGFIH